MKFFNVKVIAKKNGRVRSGVFRTYKEGVKYAKKRGWKILQTHPTRETTDF